MPRSASCVARRPGGNGFRPTPRWAWTTGLVAVCAAADLHRYDTQEPLGRAILGRRPSGAPREWTTVNLTRDAEKQLWARAGVSRIVDIRGFPYPNHDAFKAAVARGDAQLGIEYAAARDLVRTTKSPAAAVLVLGLSWVTPLLALASLVLPFASGNWWALGGAPSSFLGQFLANPYNPAKPLTKVMLAGALLHLAVNRSILHGAAWISFCFAISAITLWVWNRLAWTWAHAAALHSEALAALLFKTRNLHIRDRQGNIHDAEPSTEA